MTVDLEVLKDAITLWGTDSQLELMEEECIELALAIQKMKRRMGMRDTKYKNLIDEIADVRIMIEQMIMIFPSDQIQERIDFKIHRLKGRIEDGKNL